MPIKLPTFTELYATHSSLKKLRIAIDPTGKVHLLEVSLPIRDFKQVDEFLRSKNISNSPINNLTMWTRTRISESHYMYVDDDGYYKRLALNVTASNLYAETFMRPSSAKPILGTVWIAHEKDVL